MTDQHFSKPETLHVRVWRGARDGHFDEFSVPLRENQTVLDVVTEIQRHQDPSLSYRSAFTCLALLYEVPMIWVNILFFTAVTFGLIWLWSLVARKSSKNQPDS